MISSKDKKALAEQNLEAIVIRMEAVSGVLGCISAALNAKGPEMAPDAELATSLLHDIVRELVHDLCGVEV